ncbi:hypothetical protein [Paraburkholderia haematera]|uniref:Uncharacterized protein n=1 Tax=Paraburkholderia haematera TaxID=2793077 RepID=A0ABN7KUK8_9BURK|nr:hypothetical protein [Paraburkholderia haematera]CAE6714201.1 hypothetical protein R69888_01293 [Paraburkholderia haematera]
MSAPTGIRVGTAHHHPDHALHAVAVGVYAPALFDAHTIAWLRAESRRYRLDQDDADSIRFARILSGFRFSRNA